MSSRLYIPNFGWVATLDALTQPNSGLFPMVALQSKEMYGSQYVLVVEHDLNKYVWLLPGQSRINCVVL